MQDELWMDRAIAYAKEAASRQEVPVGAVLVDARGEMIAGAGNEVISTTDPTAHAEVVVLRSAAKKLGNYRLNHTTLYVTLEPCAMCAGALVQARVGRVVYGVRDLKAGAMGSCFQLASGEVLNHRILVDEGVRRENCLHLLQSFFRSIRE